MTRVAGALLCLCTALLVGCPEFASNECPCLLCAEAIELSIVDAVNREDVDNFSVEVTIDGSPIGEPVGCAPENRPGNQCRFGDRPGVYDLVIRSQTHATLQAAVRVASAAQSVSCCRSACIGRRTVELALEPLAP